ncbi:glycoside hydrolase family 3 N-terminal domain-containing protein [Demequina sp.]|uniref:beta-xylosidase/alpha-l-arabinosidase n=1 Tax=Demequina sp. TaxID=2050685 RepID=UPI003D1165B0
MTAIQGAPAPEHDTSTRVSAIISQLTLREKLAQLVGLWQDEAGDVVAPLQGQQVATLGLNDALAAGLGHISRVYGTNPVDPDERAAWLWDVQREIVANSRFGIPAIVHEECLTGLAAWKAATFPSPPAWGATFAPDLVEKMAGLIGSSMRDLGVHQGLAPVLDVIRDPRWGRVEECISEDPYLVGAVGTAFVRGLQEAGVHATLKHFVGYSASAAGRNFGPVHAGPRELADELLIPFEMAVKDGRVRSVMPAYTQIDGVPTHADPSLLTDVLRNKWGFDGVVVADYFGVAFLEVLHGLAADLGEAAAQALEAGVDVELPSGNAYLDPLEAAIMAGRIPVHLVDRAVERVLRQKAELGLLDNEFDGPAPTGVDLDSAEHREVAKQLAERSVVLLSNDGTLPLAPDAKVALIGPNADRSAALFGCYSFVNHVLSHRPGFPQGFESPTVRDVLNAELHVTFAEGSTVTGDDRSGFAAAVDAAEAADVAVVVAGDHAGLFGRGTVGEGCDVESLELPGVQRELVEAILDTGKPVILVLMTGRPYAVGWALERCAAVIQTFFPGEEGGTAVASVLTGRVNPSGHLPVTMPRSTGAQPYTYLHSALGGDGDVTSVGTQPVRPFGFGLSYTTFGYGELSASPEVRPDGTVTASVTVTNTGDLAGEDVVQLYVRDVLGSVARPVAQLVGFQRVALEPGASATVAFEVPTARLAFSDRALRRIVEPGEFELWVGDAESRDSQTTFAVVGRAHVVGEDDPRLTVATVS